MPLIIGSEALSIVNPKRDVRDLDIVAYKNQVEFLYNYYSGAGRVIYRGKSTCTFKGVDRRVEVFFVDTSPAWQYLFNLLKISPESMAMWHGSMNVLFAIKEAHITIPHNFEKHIYDYVWLGNKLKWKNYYPKFTDLLRREANKRVKRGSRQPKFSEAIPYDRVVKLWAKVNDGETMANHWDELTDHDKRTEIVRWCEYLALKERIIPFLFIDGASFQNSYRALKYGLRRICTNYPSLPEIVKDYSRKNYFDILRYFDTNFDTNFVLAYYNSTLPRLDKGFNAMYNISSVGDRSNEQT